MPDRPTGRSFATRSEVLARSGIAATSQPLATQVALHILKQGGNAVDAAIAANALLGLVEPTGCGIGGDLFAIVWEQSTKTLHGLNASGRSPRALTLKHLRGLGFETIPSVGPLSVSVPGAVDGWFALNEKLGQLPMAALLAPTIAYAQVGFPVTEVIAAAWEENRASLAKQPGFSETFLRDGNAPGKGEMFQNPALARTLEAIATGGRSAFYEGEIARTICASVRNAGGFLEESDLRTHASEWVQPVSSTYRGYEIWELPPNGQGIAALQILNILEGFDIADMSFGSAEHIHHFVEAKKLAYEDRAKYYADADFSEIPVAELISKDYAAKRRERIDPNRAAQSVEPDDPRLSVGDTVYLTTADAAGNMVSLIQSNFRGMGSGICPDGLGFGLQDRGELFTLESGHSNTYAPGKRPFHTIIPGFVTKESEPLMSFGVMGGDVQPQMHAQVILNIVDFGMNLQEAGDAPRVAHEGSTDPTAPEASTMRNGGTVHLESEFAHEVHEALSKRGHDVETGNAFFGGYQAIRVDEHGTYFGASESRKDGHAAGY